MLTGTIAFAALVLVFVGLSVKERMRLSMFREKSWDFFPEGKPSPLSQAVLNLMGLAGGIYLSLVMLLDFLKFQLPERIHLGQIQLEPLAAVSVALAVIQPFVSRLFVLRRRW